MKISPITLPSIGLPIPSEEDDSGFSVARRLETPIWVFDIDSARIIYANQAACNLWGAENEAILRARKMAHDMSSTVTKRLKQYQSDFKESDAAFNELWTLYPNGSPKSVMVIYKGYKLTNGRIAMQCEAVGEVKDAPENLRSAEALMHTDVMITLYSEGGPPLYLNPAARNANCVPAVCFEELFVDTAECKDFQTQVNIMGEYRVVTRVHTAFGERWHDLSAKKCLDAVTGKPALLVTAIDVSELKEARDTARQLADHDQLTNIYNRAFLQNHFAHLTNEPDLGDCAVIFLDVDRFKVINDHYGHEAGDSILRSIAERASRSVRPDDIVARIGGDEFAILLKNVDPKAELKSFVSRLRQEISKPFWHGSNRLDVTVSIGVAPFSPHATDFTEILREADVAQYTSKQAGPNRVTFYSAEMGAAAKARDKLEAELRRAFKNNEFILHYQPRLDIATGKIVSVGVLARWEHPERGLLEPDKFLTFAQELGCIAELDRQILRSAIACVRQWRSEGFVVPRLSVNISSERLIDPQLITCVEAMGDDVDFLSFELLETTFLDYTNDQVAQALGTLRRLGVEFEIDDFGTGYASILGLVNVRPTRLKVDRSLTCNVNTDNAMASLVQSIVDIARALKIEVVAEGVEGAAQLQSLCEIGCDVVQGYHLAMPVSSAAIIERYVRKPRQQTQA